MKNTLPDNVIMIISDSLRFDSVYQSGKTGTNYIERNAIQFTKAWSSGCWTLPTIGGLFTGLLPHEHKGTSQSRNISHQATTLAENLKKLGYTTVQITASMATTDIPLLNSVHLQIGGYGGYLVNGTGIVNFTDRIKSTDELINESTFNVDYLRLGESPEYNYNDTPFEEYDYGTIGGLEIYFRRGFSLELRHYYGVSNINKVDNWGTQNSKSLLELNQGSTSISLKYGFL